MEYHFIHFWFFNLGFNLEEWQMQNYLQDFIIDETSLLQKIRRCEGERMIYKSIFVSCIYTMLFNLSFKLLIL